MTTNVPSYDQIKRGLQIYEEIQRLQKELASLFGVTSPEMAVIALAAAGSSPASGKRRGRPPGAVKAAKQGRKKGANVQSEVPENELVKRRGRKPGSGASAKKGKRTISQAHREAISAAQKKRWGATEAE